jgi:hypothetical protein
MAGKKADIILIIIISLYYFSMLVHPYYLGGSMGKLISGAFIAASIIISWLSLNRTNLLGKIFGYSIHFVLFALAGTIVIDFIIGATGGTYMNIILLVVLGAGAYFGLLRKIYR